MAEKAKRIVTKKVVMVQLEKPDGLKAIDDVEGAPIEIENWPMDGKDNIIPVGKSVQVSPELAVRLINAGRIERASIQSISVEVDE